MDKSIHDNDYRLLINLLRSKREELAVTQEQLAEQLEVTQAIVSKIETFERRIDIVELRKICIALGISFIDFIVEYDKNLRK